MIGCSRYSNRAEIGASHGRKIFSRKSGIVPPGRFQLMDLAEDFRERAKELEVQEAERRQESKSHKAA